jgi:nucleotide-binding universal stress UspA family protein
MAYKRILVPVDGSSTSSAGLKEALKIAKAGKGRVRLLHVVDDTVLFRMAEPGIDLGPMLDDLKRYGKQVLQTAAKAAAARGIKAESDLSESFGLRVADIITRAAKRWRADLVVIGTHGRRGVNRLLMGSDAELVVRNTTVPVLLIHGREPRRPVRGKRKK